MNTTAQGIYKTTKAILARLNRHNVSVASAGIAYFQILALVPTLIALLSIYGLVADPANIENQVRDATQGLDTETQAFITSQLEAVVGQVSEATSSGRNRGLKWLSTVAGIAIALYSASGAVGKLMGTIAVAYDVPTERSGWKKRVTAYGFTAVAIVCVCAVVFALGLLPKLVDVSSATPPIQALITGGRYVGGVGAFYLFITIFYKVATTGTANTPWRNLGAAIATGLFVVFSLAFGFYTANIDSLPASYSVLGAIAAIMIFLQVTSFAIIVGAETNGHLSQPGLVELHSVPRNKEQPASRKLPTNDSSFGKALAWLATLFLLDRMSRR